MTFPTPPTDWVFDEPKNVAVFTTRQVIRDGSPILLVSHDADDGSWQFHTGGAVSAADSMMIVALEEIVKHDSTVCELANLPLGWQAHRDSVDSPWRRLKRED
jgi:hypothetical protein